MTALLKNLLTMSLSGSIVILLVLILRLILQKAPARLVCLLWLLAGLRLVLPFHIETNFSLQPDAQQLLKPVVSTQEYVPQDVIPPDMIPAMPTAGENISVNIGTGVTTHVQRTIDWMTVAAYVWAVGVAVMLIYTIVSYVRLKHQVRNAVQMPDGTWECSSINGAFLLGYFRPKIFIPSQITGNDREYVISHERGHIAWGDHWTKLVGFLCLSLHWFNPLVWLGYWCLCKDLETACDEQVVKGYGVDERKAYSKALLSCSVGSRPVSACPIAFGEVNVKERIMKVLNYRKPGFWICLVCVVAILGAAVFFLTDPVKEMSMEDYVALIGTERNELFAKLGFDEEEVIYSEISWKYLLPDTVQYAGREYRVYCDAGEAVHNKAVSFTFVSEPDINEQTSIEMFAQEYLAIQTQYIEQFGIPRRENVHTDVQQIVDAYENRRKTDDGSAWSITTPWEVYEGIPFANVRDFLKEFVTWEEIVLQGKWYGRDMQGLLRINLKGNYADGVVVFQITYSAGALPVETTTIKYGTVFEEYASRLGSYNEEFFDGLEVSEGSVAYTDFGAVVGAYKEYEGLECLVTTKIDERFGNRVFNVAFVAKPGESFDEMAENYLRMQELLKDIYGVPTEVSEEFSSIEQMRQSLDNDSTAPYSWTAHTTWQFESVGGMYPAVQRYMRELSVMDSVKDIIKGAYGDNAIPKMVFRVNLTCAAEDEGKPSYFNIDFTVRAIPEYP